MLEDKLARAKKKQQQIIGGINMFKLFKKKVNYKTMTIAEFMAYEETRAKTKYEKLQDSGIIPKHGTLSSDAHAYFDLTIALLYTSISAKEYEIKIMEQLMEEQNLHSALERHVEKLRSDIQEIEDFIENGLY